MNCRHCGKALAQSFLDLGFAPPSNAYLTAESLTRPEVYYPLKVQVCENCWLVQTEDYAQAGALFNSDYAYFSSTSSSWVKHASRYASKMIDQLALGRKSLVIEVAANDGYLLKNFVEAEIPCLGIEPTASTATAAERLGIVVLREFFGDGLGKQLASNGKQADLVVGNNVFAHVPDINDFTRGLKAVLKPGGTVTLEFPHLMRLIEHTQFDTIYHEHFSYLSLHVVKRIFETAGLRVVDVEELSTHGGSLRIYGGHVDDARRTSGSVLALLDEEFRCGLQTLEAYQSFQRRADNVKDNLLTFLIDKKRAGKKVAAYGAAAKGNTLLNYAGLKPDLISFVCDAAAAKQGKFMPGSHIPILPPETLVAQRPDFVLILPWNISSEILMEHRYVGDWDGKFVTAVPKLHVFD